MHSNHQSIRITFVQRVDSFSRGSRPWLSSLNDWYSITYSERLTVKSSSLAVWCAFIEHAFIQQGNRQQCNLSYLLLGRYTALSSFTIHYTSCPLSTSFAQLKLKLKKNQIQSFSPQWICWWRWWLWSSWSSSIEYPISIFICYKTCITLIWFCAEGSGSSL